MFMKQLHCGAVALIWVIGLSLSGCATRDSGYKISEETIAFVQPGVTPRSEVVENLGPPLLELKNPHVVAYSWGKMHLTGTKPTVGQDPMQGRPMGYGTAAPPEEGVSVESRRWICCLSLDDNDKVVRVGRIELQGAGSLEQAVRAWAVNGK